jgi:hypothetical protein
MLTAHKEHSIIDLKTREEIQRNSWIDWLTKITPSGQFQLFGTELAGKWFVRILDR